jgi:diguanylate cyclase (GGDEF)-like protein
MGFDPATLLTVSATALLICTLAIWASGERADVDRRWWGAAFLLGALGFGLMILSPDRTSALSRDFANVVFMFAYGCCYTGARSLAGRRPIASAIAGGAIIWLALTWGLHASAALRMPLASALVCGYALLIAGELVRGIKPEERARRFAAGLCLLHAVFFGARAVFGPTLGLGTANPDTTLNVWAAMLAFETILFSAGLSTLIAAALRDKEALADRRLALTDSLTGIGNRHAFEIRAPALLEKVCDGEPRPVLLLMDLDGFKGINDSQGHAAGDQLLVDVANAARGCLADPDLFWRIGGDEFVALLIGPAAARAPLVADAIRAAVKRSPRPFLDAGPISATIGLAPARVGASLAEILGEADIALYAGKSHGRDCVVIAGIPSADKPGIPADDLEDRAFAVSRG